MSGTGDGILVNADGGREEPRDEIEVHAPARSRHEDAPSLHAREPPKVGREAAQDPLVLELEEQVEPVPAGGTHAFEAEAESASGGGGQADAGSQGKSSSMRPGSPDAKSSPLRV